MPETVFVNQDSCVTKYINHAMRLSSKGGDHRTYGHVQSAILKHLGPPSRNLTSDYLGSLGHEEGHCLSDTVAATFLMLLTVPCAHPELFQTYLWKESAPLLDQIFLIHQQHCTGIQ